MAKAISTALPMPDKLDQHRTKFALMTSVKAIFYKLYNASATFRGFLASVSSEDSVEGTRLIDRSEAARMIRATAEKDGDGLAGKAKLGEIVRCISKIMRSHDMGLRVRRSEYLRLKHSPPATSH
jgi:hypothetical protein